MFARAQATLRILPASASAGISLAVGAGDEVRLSVSQLETASDMLCTHLRLRTGVELQTIEHVLGAIAGCGISCVRIEIDSAVQPAEPPFLDGSAAPLARGLAAAGLVRLDRRARLWTVRHPVTVTHGASHLVLAPATDGRLCLDVTVDFSTLVPSWRSQRFATFCLDHTSEPQQAAAYFLAELAPARSFTFASEVQGLVGRGLIRGGRFDNALVFARDGSLANAHALGGGLRFADEPVRHKTLDLLGDLCVLGHRLCGRLVAVRPGHAVNAALARAVAEHLVPVGEA